jgi:hypothetical protein
MVGISWDICFLFARPDAASAYLATKVFPQAGYQGWPAAAWSGAQGIWADQRDEEAFAVEIIEPSLDQLSRIFDRELNRLQITQFWGMPMNQELLLVSTNQLGCHSRPWPAPLTPRPRGTFTLIGKRWPGTVCWIW